MLSIRARLTVWNGGVIAAILLAFAATSYGLLKHGTMEQVDQTGREHLRTIVLAAQSMNQTPVGDSRAIIRLANELTVRGYYTLLDSGSNIIVASARRLGIAERENSEEQIDVKSVAPANSRLFTAIAAHLEDSQVEQRSIALTIDGENGGTRAHLRVVMMGGSRVALVAAEPLDEVDELLTQAQAIIVIAIPLLVGLALGVGYLQARSALAPVAAMTAQAQSIGARTLDQRLAVLNPHDELGQLATTFNQVLDRVDGALDQQRQFTADASHELRTPVAIIRSEADVALDAPDPTMDEFREALTVVRNGSEQLSRIVNDMFLLARADAGQAVPRLEPLYLNDLLADIARSMRSVAATRSVRIEVTAPDEMPAVADEELLRRAVINLVDNAIKYAPAESCVAVSASTSTDGHHIIVSDAGPGIPQESRALVFNRFYRADNARSANQSSHGSGAGLGLAIAREIAELHGGQLTLVDYPNGNGRTSFCLLLPLP